MSDDLTFPEGFTLAQLGAEPDYGYWHLRGGRAVVLGRAVANGRGGHVARALGDVPLPVPMDTTESARAYALTLSGWLAEHGEEQVGVDTLIMHTEEGGLGGFCLGSAGVWVVGAKEVTRCTPDRTVGAQVRAMGVAADPRTENLSTTRILARGVDGGDVYYGAGTRFIAMIAWPLPDLTELPHAELAGDPAEALSAVLRLVHRSCALQHGLVAIWDTEEPHASAE